MKYLLTQRIMRKSVKEGIKIYPGNPELIKLANKCKIHYQKIEKRDGEHLITDYYLFTEKDYFWLLARYKTQITEKRKLFFSQDPLLQVLKLLKYIFNRNTKAKTVDKYYASLNAYGDKTTFLELALQIASQIKYSFFKFGYQLDSFNSYHCYIYYFEIENIGQVSFHSEQLFSNVPEFTGKWIGVRNDTFPFDLKYVKKLIKKNTEVKIE